MAAPVRQLFECLSCGGRYFDLGTDGTIYMHVCGTLPATKDEPERERPNKRDENLQVDARRRPIGIRSEGDGVRCLTYKRLANPPWITAIKVQAEKWEEEENA